jgi:cyclin-dependent kinase-like
MFMRNPRFLGLKFPNMNKPETLDRHYLGKLPKIALQFMNDLLKMDPNDRLTSQHALNHPYFDGLQSDLTNENAINNTIMPSQNNKQRQNKN